MNNKERYNTTIQFPDKSIYDKLKILADFRGKPIGILIQSLLTREIAYLAREGIHFSEITKDFRKKERKKTKRK